MRTAELLEPVLLGLLLLDQGLSAGPKELSVVELDLVALLVLREGAKEALVGLLREGVGVGVLGLLGLVVPDRRHLLHRVEGLVTTLPLDRLLEFAVAELVPVGAELVGLLPLDVLVVGRQSVDDDSPLPLAGLRVLREGLLQLLVDVGRLRVEAAAEVTDCEQLHHLPRHALVLLGTVADLLEELVGLGDLADLSVGLDHVTTGVAAELLGVALGAGAAFDRRLHRVDEVLQAEVVARLGGADRVEVTPAHLVEGVGVDRAVLEGDDLLVEPQRVADLVLVEVVVGEREVGVRDVLAVRVVLNQLDVGVLHLRLTPELTELEGVEVEGLVDALVLRQRRRHHERFVELDGLTAGLLGLVVKGLLLRLELLRLALLALLLGGEDLLVERARLELEVGLLLEEVIREAEEEIGVLWIRRIRRVEKTLELLDLLVSDLLLDRLALLREVGARDHRDLAGISLLLLLLLFLELRVQVLFGLNLAGRAAVLDAALLFPVLRFFCTGNARAAGEERGDEGDAGEETDPAGLQLALRRVHGPLYLSCGLPLWAGVERTQGAARGPPVVAMITPLCRGW